jgi:hypothetical protein
MLTTVLSLPVLVAVATAAGETLSEFRRDFSFCAPALTDDADSTSRH